VHDTLELVTETVDPTRHIASRCLITARWVPLHAAAAVTRAGLIVLAGPSGAGKTTALLQLLAERLGQTFVANDKVYLTIGITRVFPPEQRVDDTIPRTAEREDQNLERRTTGVDPSHFPTVTGLSRHANP
jgi:hypothetical protein